MSDGRYFIEDVKYGTVEGGIACGPCSGDPVISVRYSNGDERKWIHLVAVSGITTFMVMDEDIFEGLLSDDYIEKNIDMLNSFTVKEFNGIDVSDDLHTLWGSIKEQPDNPAVPLMKLFIGLYYSDDADRFANSIKGKYADEVEVHLTDIECEFE